MNKKILNLVLAVILAFTFVATTSVCAFAAGPSLTVSKVSETPSTVTVAVGVSGNDGIGALGVNLGYESTLLAYEKTESTGVAKSAGMAVYGTPSGDAVRIVVEEGGSGQGAKSDGNVCLVTFKKLSTVEDGSNAKFNASSISTLTYDLEGKDVEIKDGSADLTLDKAEQTTKKPVATTKKPVATTKKPATTNKPVATTKKPVVTTKPNVVSPTLPGVAVPTTVPETTTEEVTTEEFTTEEWTTEYESYSYTAPDKTDDEIDDEKSDSTKRIAAIIVVVVCVGAAAALYFTRRK